MRFGNLIFIIALTLAAPSALAAAKVSGELRQWHKVTLTFDGPQASESGSPNPFLDYRLEVTFTQGGQAFTVPGYFAAGGNAGNAGLQGGATTGNRWRVHFMPPTSGSWSYQASLRSGSGVAVATQSTAGTPVGFDGETGSFTVTASDKSAPDLRALGLLQPVAGKHHLRFAGSQSYFLKGGADSPENFLGYDQFDGTPNAKHSYAPHAQDYTNGDPTWTAVVGGKEVAGAGKNIIGALNYLASKGMNSVYFLTMNVGGDGKDVWPWTSSSERARFDCSKLDQWEVVFSHMTRLGVMLHVVTQETENDQLLDGGALGPQRRLYYRELIARFAHHPALVWNLGEENTNTAQQLKDFIAFFAANDPYGHPVVVHTYPGQYSKVYTPLLGMSGFHGVSLQMGDMTKTHDETKQWIDSSGSAGQSWFACLDEIGPASTGVKTDANDYWHDDVRRHALWGNLMAGGAGVEWYFGYQQPHDNLDCEDWRSRDHMWDLTRYALEFFQQHLPFQLMSSDDSRVSGASGAWCLSAPSGQAYAVYLPAGGSPSLTLPAGTFDVAWYDPRHGGALQQGTVQQVSGPGSPSLGAPPQEPAKDWAVLVKPAGSLPPPPPLAVTHFTLIDAAADTAIAAYDPLPDGATLNLAQLPSKELSIEAQVSGNVASVVFHLNGAQHHTEGKAPWALDGDDQQGDYVSWTPAPGSYTVEATPYDQPGGGGSAGTPHQVSLTVIDDPTVDGGLPDLPPPQVDAATVSADAGAAAVDGAAVADGPAGAADGGTARDEDGCSCAVAWRPHGAGTGLGPLLLLLLVGLRRRRVR